MTRAAARAGFVAGAGWGDAALSPLAGDASERRYFRLRRDAAAAVLMDAPPGQADDPAAFVAMANHLAGIGLSPPRVLAADLAQGFLLLEDLGDGLFARLCAQDGAQEPALYRAATDVLAHLHRHPAPPDLPNLTAPDWAMAAGFAFDWYLFAATGDAGDKSAFTATLAELIARYADGPRVVILRDYHAENLLWLPARAGVARVGLLDFQLGQMGQPGYDLVSLVQDARRDVAPGLEPAMLAHFADVTGRQMDELAPAHAVLGAQRALRILGIFARLCLRGGKAGYVALLPRVWGHLQRNLARRELAPLARQVQVLPPPDAALMERIARQCATTPHR